MHESLSQYSSRQLSRYRAMSIACTLLALFIGGAALLGWILDNEVLKRIRPSLVTMKANTAVCLILISASLLLLRNPLAPRWQHRLGHVFAAVVAGIALVTLSEHLLHRGPGIDQLLFYESRDEAGLSFPGRIGVASPIDFT